MAPKFKFCSQQQNSISAAAAMLDILSIDCQTVVDIK